LNKKPEAVQELRPQLALFRIHRPHEHEARLLRCGQPIALHSYCTGRCGIEQQIDQMVREQIHFIHIQHTAIRLRQQAGTQLRPPLPQRLRHVKCTDYAILGSTKRQLDERRCVTVGPRRKKIRERPCCRALCRTALTADQHTANGRIDSDQKQRELQIILTDDGGERKKVSH